MWLESREEEEEERKAQYEHEGGPYEPVPEPKLPSCIQQKPPRLFQSAASLARGRKSKRLIAAAERLRFISHRAECPILPELDREDLFLDADPPIPLIALAFGEHDAVIDS